MLRGIWVLAVLLVATPLCGIPAILINLLAPRGHAVAHAARLWSRVMLAAAGVRVEYEGLERIDPERSYVFIANHQSSVDIWVLMRALPPRMRFAAKEELRRVPVIGWALSASGSIFIDRADRRRAIGSLRQAAERIRQGASVVLFAEGTRSLDGALHAAVPVVPIAISGSWSVMRPGSVRVHPGVVRVRLLEPIEVGPWLPDGVDELRRHVHGAVRAALEPAAS